MRRHRTTCTAPAAVGEASAPASAADTAVTEMAAAVEAACHGGRNEAHLLFGLLLDVDRDRAVGTSHAALRLLGRASPKLWIGLDDAGRHRWWEEELAWQRRARSEVAAGEPGLLTALVGSFHPSGYARKAVARCGSSDAAAASIALALRACDRVPQVRDRARTLLASRLASAGTLATVGPAAIALAGRAQGGWLADRLASALGAASDAELAALRSHDDQRLRRLAYEVSLRDERLGIDGLLAAVVHDRDLVIRTRCADAAIRWSVAAGRLDLVRRLATSGTAAVRAAVVLACGRAGETDVALAALPDRHPAVREIAQAAVRRAGRDPADLYRGSPRPRRRPRRGRSRASARRVRPPTSS